VDYVLQGFDRPRNVRRAANVSFITSHEVKNGFTGSKSNAHPRALRGEISIFEEM